MKKLFIVGVGRSGTSMLQVMFNAHPKITFLPETSFLRNYVLNGKNKSFKRAEEKKAFLETLKQDPRLKRLHLADLDSLVKKSESHFEVYKNVLKEYKNYVVGDKDPRLIDYLESIKYYFPNSKIVHIIRDPRDVVLSRTKADWSKHWPFSLHSYLYNTQVARGRKQGQELFGEDYIEIKYENLIRNPAKELKILCESLKLDFNESMLDFGEKAKDLVDESEMQWKKEVLGPLLHDNHGKWKQELSPKKIDLIQKICKSSFDMDGYKLAEEDYGFSLSTQFHVLGSKIFKIIYPLRIKVLK